jgi:hypothetical protein
VRPRHGRHAHRAARPRRCSRHRYRKRRLQRSFSLCDPFSLLSTFCPLPSGEELDRSGRAFPLLLPPELCLWKSPPDVSYFGRSCVHFFLCGQWALRSVRSRRRSKRRAASQTTPFGASQNNHPRLQHPAQHVFVLYPCCRPPPPDVSLDPSLLAALTALAVVRPSRVACLLCVFRCAPHPAKGRASFSSTSFSPFLGRG